MNNESLFLRIKKLVSTERRIGVEILECLYEIEFRKAYAELRYDGLFTYCVKELGFTDSQAYQRIQAMRALKEIPELKPMIESGSLSVSSVAKVQTHIRREKQTGKTHAKAEKLDLFQAMENRTSREVDAELAAVRGEKPKTKINLELDDELSALWKKIKGLAAHRTQGEDVEVFRMLAKEWVLRHDPTRTVADRSQRAVPLSTQVTKRRDSRYVPTPLRRAVWRRDEAKCKRCSSTHALEIDHVTPFALGGGTTLENLRLLCRSCNQFAAIEVFGAEKVRGRRSPSDLNDPSEQLD